jgi:YARHG domain
LKKPGNEADWNLRQKKGFQVMRTVVVATGILLAATLAGSVAVRAQGDACSQLWVARNSVFKANGYCFKTSRAIRYFGNAGCRYDNEDAVPLTPYDRGVIANIQAREAALGCRD